MIKIVVDSGCDLTDEMKTEKLIESVPLNLQIDNKNYVDDDGLNLDEYINDMVASKNPAKTSAPSPEKYLDAYRGKESVFAITLSSKLSGSYNSACLAKDLFLEEVGDKFIHVVDSLSASVGEMIIANKINEFFKNNLSEIEIKDKITDFVREMKTYFILDKFDNLAKNGRVSPAIAKIASVLSLKPICEAVNGEIVMLEKHRGFKKATQKLAELIKGLDINFEDRILAISHVKCIDKALAIKEELSKQIKFKDIMIVETGGLCSTYAYVGGVILCF